jgi:hypothetical protein
MDEAFHVAVDVACGNVCKDVQILDLFSEALHSQGAFDVAFNGPVEPLIEVNTCGTVDDDIAGVNDELQVFGTQANILFLKVALTRLMKRCTWV